MIRVLIWNEFRHERTKESVRAVYPEGIHGCIRDFLAKNDDLEIVTATLSMDGNDCGLTDDLLNSTDVLIWWGHMKHQCVPDEWVEKIRNRVLRGMGLIVLHSGHHSKIFRALMGTTCNLQWREDERERLWNIAPNHPVMKGIPAYFELPQEEMYGERFDIPQPDELLMMGWFSGGEVMRSGCTFTRGLGRILYLQPGHEAYPIFRDENIQKLITNGVYWAAPNVVIPELTCPHAKVSPEALLANGEPRNDGLR